MKIILFILTAVLISETSFAQIPNVEMRLRNLEQKTYQLEKQNMDLNRRVTDLERYLYNNPYPPPPPPTSPYVCVVSNSYYYTSYIGKSISKLEASSIAQNECNKNTGSFSHRCQPAECEIEGVYVVTCQIKNTYYNTSYLGKSKSKLESQAIAQNECVRNTGSFSHRCDENTAVCE